MKKIILALVLAILFFPATVRADCAQPRRVDAAGGRPTCLGVKPINCVSDTTGYPILCCDQPSKCPANSVGTQVGVQQDLTGTSPLCGDNNLGVNTAIGCLMAGSPKELITQLLGWGVTVGGGIAFLMIILAGFQMTTAAGDPKKVQAARELLMSAIGGLILIVLSVVLLNFIGVKILNLPGFAGNTDLNL